jgi:heme A synthase
LFDQDLGGATMGQFGRLMGKAVVVVVALPCAVAMFDTSVVACTELRVYLALVVVGLEGFVFQTAVRFGFGESNNGAIRSR